MEELNTLYEKILLILKKNETNTLYEKMMLTLKKDEIILKKLINNDPHTCNTVAVSPDD